MNAIEQRFENTVEWSAYDFLKAALDEWEEVKMNIISENLCTSQNMKNLLRKEVEITSEIGTLEKNLGLKRIM